LQFQLLGYEYREPWRKFIAKSPIGDVLQTMEWGEIKRASGWEPFHAALMDGEVICGAALVLKRRVTPIGHSIFYCPRGPTIDYTDASAFSQLMGGIHSLARKERAILLKIDPAIAAPNHEIERLLREHRFRMPPEVSGGFGGTQPRSVMKLDLTKDEETLLANMKPKTRYNLRLAERKGVQVTDDCTEEDLRTFYDILLETARRDHFVVRSFSYFRLIWQHLVRNDLARLFVARYEGEMLAGALAFVLGRQCWYVYGASSNRRRNLMPNYLLQWRMIQWAKSQGCEVYDFRGVSPERDGIPLDDHLAGLNRFKSGFGAQYVEYLGEFDLPFRMFWYKLWTVGKPMALKILKKHRSSSSEEA